MAGQTCPCYCVVTGNDVVELKWGGGKRVRPGVASLYSWAKLDLVWRGRAMVSRRSCREM